MKGEWLSMKTDAGLLAPVSPSTRIPGRPFQAAHLLCEKRPSRARHKVIQSRGSVEATPTDCHRLDFVSECQ